GIRGKVGSHTIQTTTFKRLPGLAPQRATSRSGHTFWPTSKVPTATFKHLSDLAAQGMRGDFRHTFWPITLKSANSIASKYMAKYS
ncbi:hypothetical protein, partial [Bifidobacterium tsurumiense]|uniref:hypothetical protein n=1 Tax=Bifidobacterium tsurumiense TaxID=356829 RepID=UPI001EE6621F